MKKIIASLLALCMVICFAACSKKEPEVVGIKVYVTISTAGNVQIAAQEVIVSDLDSDGKYTIDETLVAAHKKYCDNKQKGYETEEGMYGLAITKLWNDANGMSGYGYYINNVGAMNLSDEVKEGDYVYAYSYKDLTYWTDAYSYFDNLFETADGEITLHLNIAGYDANWQPMVLDGAGLNVWAENVPLGTTDANGKVTFSLNGKDKIVITATAPEGVIVPPICIINSK